MMIAAMMAATVSASAQFEQGTFSIQPKVGVGLSWLSNMPDLDLKVIGLTNAKFDKSPAASASIGAEAEYQLAPQFSLAAGVNYSLQGCGWEDKSISVNNEVVEVKDSRIELGYINLPITANYYLFKGFAEKAGVQFGFMTNASLKMTTEQDKTKETADRDIKDNLKKFDISIPMGVSYQFKVPIVLDLRYNLGLTKVNKEDIPGVDNYKNNVVQLTVGYKFHL